MTTQAAQAAYSLKHSKRFWVKFVLAVFLAAPFAACRHEAASRRELRITDWQTGRVYAALPVAAGDELFFGWIHSLENIPWHEYYLIDENFNLVLQAVSFPSFAAGTPHDIGSVRIEGGLIYMEEINQKFDTLVWINSACFTGEIRLAGETLSRGSDLPHHRRLVLSVWGR